MNCKNIFYQACVYFMYGDPQDKQCRNDQKSDKKALLLPGVRVCVYMLRVFVTTAST